MVNGVDTSLCVWQVRMGFVSGSASNDAERLWRRDLQGWDGHLVRQETGQNQQFPQGKNVEDLFDTVPAGSVKGCRFLLMALSMWAYYKAKLNL